MWAVEVAFGGIALVRSFMTIVRLIPKLKWKTHPLPTRLDIKVGTAKSYNSVYEVRNCLGFRYTKKKV